MDQQITSEKILLDNIKTKHLSLADWQNEKLNFVSLRGSWFASSEADFDLEEEINKFLSPQNNRKIMLLMGDSGAGKSLYTQGLVNKLWQNFSAQSPIPIWISLPSIKDPINKVIEETFKKFGFNKDQIRELRKTRSFVFILDAYDEIRCEKNLYQTNYMKRWNAKIIITCHREYLYHKDNYKLFFAPFVGDKIQYIQYEEIYIRSFNSNQIQTYVLHYIKTQAVNWKEHEKYQKAIDEITGLKELIKTPFMLKLTMEVLPQIVEKYATHNIQERKKITQAALYDVFIEQWFIRQEKKLKEAKLVKTDENIKPEFWAYAKELATEMHQANVTQVNYNVFEESDLFSTETKENTWSKFFTPKNPRVELFRSACLVREDSPHHYSFIHSSFIEYFLTRKLYENLYRPETMEKNQELKLLIITNNQSKAAVSGSSLPSSHLASSTQVVQQSVATSYRSGTTSNNTSQHDYFNQRLLTQETNALQFLADRVLEKTGFKEALFERVYSSKNNPNNKIAAANAITILNKAKIAFSGMDLSGIQIPNADLSYGIYNFTNFAKSDLSNVNLSQAYLCDADMREVDLTGIDLGQRPFFESKGCLKALCYSRNGLLIAIASDLIVLWDPHYNKEQGRLRGDWGYVLSVAFSPDGKLLASGGEDRTVRLWDIENQVQRAATYTGHEVNVTTVAFSSDGKLLASGSWDTTVRLWDVESLKQRGKPLTGHKGWVYSVAFSPDGKMLASGSDTVRLWDVESQIQRGAAYTGHTGDVNSVDFSPDGKLLASGSDDYTVRIWDVENHMPLGVPLIGHTRKVTSVHFSLDGKMLASGSDDYTVRIWDVENHMPLGVPLVGHMRKVTSVHFSSDGKLLASGSEDGTVRLWDMRALLTRGGHFTGHKGNVYSVVFCTNGKLFASGSDDNTLRLWSVESHVPRGAPFTGHTSRVNSVCCSPDGKLLASGSGDETVRLWDVETQAQQGSTHPGHTKFVSSVVFSPDGRLLASGSYDNTVRLWDVETQTQQGSTLKGHTSYVKSVVFSPDGKLLASGSDDKTVRLWDVENQLQRGEPLIGHTWHVNCVAFSQNGKLLASGGGYEDNTVRVWDIEIHKPLGKPLSGHTDSITSVAFGHDGRILVSGSQDHTIWLWAVATQQSLHVINGGTNVVWSVNFNRDSSYIAFACGSDVGLLQFMPTDLYSYRYCLVWYEGTVPLMAIGLNLENVQGLSVNNHQLLSRLSRKEAAKQKAIQEPIIDNFANLEVKRNQALLSPRSTNLVSSSIYSAKDPYTLFQSEEKYSESTTKKQNRKDKNLAKSIQSSIEDEEEQKEKCLVM